MANLGEKIKDILGIEGEVKDTLIPACNYTCANITLGGAGYVLNQFHQQFLAYVEGMGTRDAGKISLINGLWDAFNDPVMGMITDRTRTKYGRHRPYLIIGIIPFAIAYVFRWYSFGLSSGGDATATWLWYLFSAVLYSTSYTVMSIPHTAMLPQIAPHYFQRTQFRIVEYAMNSVGQISSYLFAALALSGFSVKTALTALPNPTPDDRGKYLLVGVILSLWFLWPPILSFFKCKEPSSLGQPKDKINFRFLFNEYKLVFKNRSFRQYFIITLFYALSKNFYHITDQYFMISVADMYKLFISLNIISGIAEFSGAPLNYLLVRYKGKAFCGKLLGPLMVCGLFLNIFISPNSAQGFKTAIIILSAILYNFGFSGPGFVAENIQPDITDVDEMITGRRREGVVATFRTLFSKTIASVISYVVGASLELFGYNPQIQAPSLQSPKTLFGLRFNFVIMPTVLALICVLSIYSYTMNKKDHEYIKELIKERHEKGFVEKPAPEKLVRLEKITGQKWENMWISSKEG
jgi:oligogalacturonide transporter